jgi:hypothetical protein
MGLFNLFGGKKKDDARAATAPAAKSAQPAPRTVEARANATELPAATTTQAKMFEEAGLPVSASALTQVRLRLKLASSLRSGEHAKAYEAAKGLADMQAKAGRRVGARIWTAEAERILAKQEAA